MNEKGKSVEKQLEHEIKKWSEKIKIEMKNIKVNEKNKSYVENINAYISDSEHFKKNGNLVLSFEAIIWAWAWLQILREMKIVN